MNEQEQRIAIAEALGWKPETRRMYGGVKNVKGWGINLHLGLGDKDRDFTMSPNAFPDYLNDLNAMAVAEKLMTGGFKPGDRWLSYVKYLHAATGGKGEGATAAQRAEAFLRTLNLWKE